MSSTLALVFCTAFVLYALRIERKQSPETTRSLWVPTVWLLYAASKPLAVWFGVKTDDPEAGSSLDRIFLIVLILLAVSILVRRKFDLRGCLGRNKWLAVLIVFMLVSVLWSPFIFTSFKRWAKELAAVLMALAVASEPSPRRAMESILRRTTYILIPFSMMLINYFPIYGRQYGRYSGSAMWIGVTTQKNGLGRLCLISSFFLIWSLVRRRQGSNPSAGKAQSALEVLFLLLSLYMLRGPSGSYSATAIAALLLGLAAYFGFLFMKKRGRTPSPGLVTTAAAALIFVGVATLFAGGSNLRSFVSTLGRESTLTGRTEVWAVLLPMAMSHGALGHGFGGFWTQRMRTEFITEGHNGYLDILLDTGFVGLVLMAGFIMSSARRGQRELGRDPDWGILWLSLIIMVLIHNITESSLNSLSSHLTALILFLSVSSSMDRVPAAVPDAPGSPGGSIGQGERKERP